MIKIERYRMTPDHTEGKLFLNDRPLADTLELPWKDNEQDVSCIPAGEYALKQRTAGRYYEAYRERFDHRYSLWVSGVKGRKWILIHTGNTTEDILGCILVGVKARDGVVLKSREVYNEMWHKIDIEWPQDSDVMPLQVIEFDRDAEFWPIERKVISAAGNL